ncbi:MAG: NAD(P)/FAD-dependent oxidoreductase [Alphaproteobacteria bacterium]|nr:NAD(P)/FAD-dependent oxidoreductase [Alphaproteobacteria bacterium]
MKTSAYAKSLEALEARVRVELELMNHPSTPWVPARQHASGAPVYDVAIIGGGQSGLSILFALGLENVTNIVALDRNPAGREGPWMTYARMNLLRTNKNVTGPALGFPSLTPRAWYTAKHSPESWDALERFSRLEWQEYLDWYRRVLDLPVQNETEAGPLEPEHPDKADSLIRIPLKATGPSGQTGVIYAREVVLANGLEGCGKWHIPEVISGNLPSDRYVQANTEFDFDALRAKRVTVVGANASGFDAAAVALENGASRVDLLVRRPEIPKINAHRPLDTNTWHRHFADLDSATRWRLMVHIMRNNQPPPQDTFDRARNLPGFRMHEDFAIQTIRLEDDGIAIRSAKGDTLQADFVIAATGFICDFKLRVETSAIAQHIALWRDRYAPPAETDWEPMGTYPWLEGGFAFQEKEPGAAPWLHHIYCYSLGTKPSLGLTGGSASSIRFAVPRLIQDVSRQLFLDDEAHHTTALHGHDGIDLTL